MVDDRQIKRQMQSWQYWSIGTSWWQSRLPTTSRGSSICVLLLQDAKREAAGCHSAGGKRWATEKVHKSGAVRSPGPGYGMGGDCDWAKVDLARTLEVDSVEDKLPHQIHIWNSVDKMLLNLVHICILAIYGTIYYQYMSLGTSQCFAQDRVMEKAI